MGGQSESPLIRDGTEPLLSDGVVLLRRWRESDVGQLVECCQDPAIQRFIPIPLPYGIEAAEQYVTRTKRQWCEGTKAAFAIVRPDDDTSLLGAINVAVSGSVGNAGYWVAPGARGRGVATRALRLLTGWAFEELGLGVVVLEIRPENVPSIAVALAAGYHEAGKLDVAGDGEHGTLLFARLASDCPPEPA